MTAWLRRPMDDLVAALEPLVDAPRAAVALGFAVLGLVVAWFVYVPIHELLHATACLATGGSVSELQIQEIYGGAWLAEWFSFVKAGGEYPGRLTGFDTHGSDLVYAATDLGPYLLSVFPGVYALRRCAAQARPLLFGPAVVLATAPFLNLLGDYFELASLAVTRVAALAVPGGLPEITALRSDDALRTWSALLDGSLAVGVGPAAAFGITLATLALGLALAFVTYAVGGALASQLGAKPSDRVPHRPADDEEPACRSHSPEP